MILQNAIHTKDDKSFLWTQTINEVNNKIYLKWNTQMLFTGATCKHRFPLVNLQRMEELSGTC